MRFIGRRGWLFRLAGLPEGTLQSVSFASTEARFSRAARSDSEVVFAAKKTGAGCPHTRSAKVKGRHLLMDSVRSFIRLTRGAVPAAVCTCTTGPVVSRPMGSLFVSCGCISC